MRRKGAKANECSIRNYICVGEYVCLFWRLREREEERERERDRERGSRERYRKKERKENETLNRNWTFNQIIQWLYLHVQ